MNKVAKVTKLKNCIVVALVREDSGDRLLDYFKPGA
ncbi:hypothetical protein NIES4073_02080 (plasmid) [Kalymmatonema gypsitolerans NIES-4073]|nr:hypothetical protein NIES4073_02080 [Scytonema sp. NIES-4073]